MRQEFEMTEEDLKVLIDAGKPTPAMFLSGGTPMCASPQENANQAWANLGKKMGFKEMTVQAVNGKGKCFFTAEAIEISLHKKVDLRDVAEGIVWKVCGATRLSQSTLDGAVDRIMPTLRLVTGDEERRG